MEPNCDKVRLQFDGLELHFDREFGWSRKTGWSVKRDGSFVVSMVPWEEAWAALTSPSGSAASFSRIPCDKPNTRSIIEAW